MDKSDWRAISTNPNATDAILSVSQHLTSQTRLFDTSKIELLKTLFSGKSVLDIGGAGHVVKESRSEWPHEIIRTTARSIIGIDIDSDKCEYYNSLGYTFLNIDACSNRFLGKKFDAINCGDVIEHVNNPVLLIEFITNHLARDGFAVISTPNPFFEGFSTLRSARREVFYTPNLSHISWITPANMLEICYRGSARLKEIYIPRSASEKSQNDHRPIETLFHEYIFILKSLN